MRITPTQSNVIRDTILARIGVARVYLFGSRADDSKKGGDIDLYVETNEPVSALTRARISGDLTDALEIGVDVVVNDHRKNEPIYDIAKRTGVRLA